MFFCRKYHTEVLLLEVEERTDEGVANLASLISRASPGPTDESSVGSST